MYNNNDLNHSLECHQQGCFCKRCEVNKEDKERQKCVDFQKIKVEGITQTVIGIAAVAMMVLNNMSTVEKLNIQCLIIWLAKLLQMGIQQMGLQQ
ncbi:hypothetical protein pb186bvf_012394 [Paramecium bursaria]